MNPSVSIDDKKYTYEADVDTCNDDEVVSAAVDSVKALKVDVTVLMLDEVVSKVSVWVTEITTTVEELEETVLEFEVEVAEEFELTALTSVRNAADEVELFCAIELFWTCSRFVKEERSWPGIHRIKRHQTTAVTKLNGASQCPVKCAILQ